MAQTRNKKSLTDDKHPLVPRRRIGVSNHSIDDLLVLSILAAISIDGDWPVVGMDDECAVFADRALLCMRIQLHLAY